MWDVMCLCVCEREKRRALSLDIRKLLNILRIFTVILFFLTGKTTYGSFFSLQLIFVSPYLLFKPRNIIPYLRILQMNNVRYSRNSHEILHNLQTSFGLT